MLARVICGICWKSTTTGYATPWLRTTQVRERWTSTTGFHRIARRSITSAASKRNSGLLKRSSNRGCGGGFGIKDGGQRVNDGRDSNRGEHGFFVHTFFTQHFFVSVDADSAAAGGRNGETPPFEGRRIAAVPGDHLHTQTRGHRGVLFVAAEVAEAVEDVVHPHDGGRRLGGEQRLFIEMGGGFREAGSRGVADCAQRWRRQLRFPRSAAR